MTLYAYQTIATRGRKDDRAEVAIDIVAESVFVGYSPFLQGGPQSWHAKFFNKKIPHALQVVHPSTVVFYSTYTNFCSNHERKLQIL